LWQMGFGLGGLNFAHDKHQLDWSIQLVQIVLYMRRLCQLRADYCMSVMKIITLYAGGMVQKNRRHWFRTSLPKKKLRCGLPANPDTSEVLCFCGVRALSAQSWGKDFRRRKARTEAAVVTE
jgi:hypothetical protein